MPDTSIRDALEKLDPTNDSHWTADGNVRLDTVRNLANNGSLTRSDIDREAPGFSRSNAATYFGSAQQAAQQPAQAEAKPVATPWTRETPDTTSGPTAEEGPSPSGTAANPAVDRDRDPADVIVKPEPGEVESDRSGEELARVQAYIKEKDEAIGKLINSRSDVNRQIAELQAERDVAAAHEAKLLPSSDAQLTSTISDYLKSQKQLTSKRADIRDSITGEEIAKLSAARSVISPLDIALAQHR